MTYNTKEYKLEDKLKFRYANCKGNYVAFSRDYKVY
jgi:hypothetical protein